MFRARLLAVVAAASFGLAVPAAAVAFSPRTPPQIDVAASSCVIYPTYTAVYVYWDAAAGRPTSWTAWGSDENRITGKAISQYGYVSMGIGALEVDAPVTLSNRDGTASYSFPCNPAP